MCNMASKKGMHVSTKSKGRVAQGILGDCKPLPSAKHPSCGSMVVDNHHSYGSTLLMHPFESKLSKVPTRSYGGVGRDLI